jgi:hypothetical protein
MDTGINQRPCDYFDWIGGVGAGGHVVTSRRLRLIGLTIVLSVVATLLVTFAMSPDEALVTFARICAAVFPDEQATPAERATTLEAIMETLLEETNISPDAKLMDESNPTIKCRLYVPRIVVRYSSYLMSLQWAILYGCCEPRSL